MKPWAGQHRGGSADISADGHWVAARPGAHAWAMACMVWSALHCGPSARNALANNARLRQRRASYLGNKSGAFACIACSITATQLAWKQARTMLTRAPVSVFSSLRIHTCACGTRGA